MFANLKNKLIEEVKASPSKFQQFAAQAQAAVSSSSSSSTPSGSDSTTTTTTTANENFFSITEEDTPQNSPFRPLRLPSIAVRPVGSVPQNGSTSGARSRKLSNSSMASDVSFRLPSYDAPAVYHLQSDLESEIGSEMDETASTTKIDVITKEQLFAAYRRSMERYNKYRCRYTDLARKYKDLETDSSKARSVLVETQEKAIRRINELREQCGLEQQAKAHLEEALRVEMDDMQCKIQTYQTKLKLLGENPEKIQLKNSATKDSDGNQEQDQLIDLDENSVTVAREESLLINLDAIKDNEAAAERLKYFKEQLIDRERQIQSLTETLQNSNKEVDSLRKQEEENALLLAQTKQAVHTELESKEIEVKNLKDKLKELQKNVDAALKKETKLSEQESELNDVREKLKQAISTKQEVDAKLIAIEHMYSTLKEQFAAREKSNVNFEEKIAVLSKENEQKLQDLRQQNTQLNEMLQRYQQNEVSIAEVDNELNRTRNENFDLKVSLTENDNNIAELRNQIEALIGRISDIESERNDLQRQLIGGKEKIESLEKQLEEENSLRTQNGQKVKQLESELRILKEQNVNNESETIAALKSEFHRINTEVADETNALKEQLSVKEKELKSLGNKVSKHKKQYEHQQNKMKEQNEELERLRLEINEHTQHIATIQNNAKEREAQLESEKEVLKTQITGMIDEISKLEEQAHIMDRSQRALHSEKSELEARIENLQQERLASRDQSQKDSRDLHETDQKLKQVEAKMLNIQSENVQLAESNCLLEEKCHRFEKALNEREREQNAEAVNLNALHSKLEAAEDAYCKLNEKMSQILDENSRMHNAQELMDHDHRSLQDKYDALEKEKLILEDAQRCFLTELEEMKRECNARETKILELDEKLKEFGQQNVALQHKLDALESECNDIKQEKMEFARISEDLKKQIVEFQAAQVNSDDDQRQLNFTLAENFQLKEKLQQQKQSLATNLQEKQRMLDELSAKLIEADSRCEKLEHIQEEIAMAREQRCALEEKIVNKDRSLTDLNIKLEQLSAVEKIKCQLENEKETLVMALKQQRDSSSSNQEELEKLKTEIRESNEKLRLASDDIMNLKSKEQQLNGIIEDLNQQNHNIETKFKERLKSAQSDIEKLHENNIVFQVEIEKLNNKHQMEIKTLEESLKRLQDEHSKLQIQVGPENQRKINNYDELLIENEYLNKNVKQLEQALEEQKQEAAKKTDEIETNRDKLKSIQCELYVLKENAAQHAHEISVKEQETLSYRSLLEQLKGDLEEERSELKRQTEHAQYLNEQIDGIQKELLQTQHQLRETTDILQNTQMLLTHAQDDYQRQLDQYTKEVEKLKLDLQDKENVETELQALKIQLEEVKGNVDISFTSKTDFAESNTKYKSIDHSDPDHLRRINKQLQCELEDLRYKTSVEISSLQEQVEVFQNNSRQMAERIMELERLRAGLQAQKLFSNDIHSGTEISQHHVNESGTTTTNHNNNNQDFAVLAVEKAELEQKLKEIVNDIREVSARNVFLEQKCENYLILEQSNERLKSQNAKLARQLDETLVSLQHNENITANTEFEYLRNIMFQYLTGSANGNNETLVKVISAVLKFSPQQTQVALEKEHQRRSLINKIL